MKNWYYSKNGYIISWFNFKNLEMDSSFREADYSYRHLGEKYWKKRFQFITRKWGIGWMSTWNESSISWETPRNYYVLTYRSSDSVLEKGKWTWKFLKRKRNIERETIHSIWKNEKEG